MSEMDAKPKGAYHHHDLRRALIKTAKEVVDQAGRDKLTLRGLAKRLGVSHAAVYRHFANKESLLLQVAIAGFKQLVAALKRAGRQADSPKSALIHCSMAYVRFGLRNPGLYDLVFSPAVQQDEESRAYADWALDVVASIVTEAQLHVADEEDFDAYDLARTAWALVHGLVDLSRRQQLGVTTQKQVLARAEALLSAMYSGVTV